ncbi:hypothetical protein FXO38_32823 [Capsicum annuum]|nr:hypothetical protein FXO38_32823 [Capsicum annuum]
MMITSRKDVIWSALGRHWLPWLMKMLYYLFVCMDPKSSDAEVVATDTGADKLLSTKTEEEIMRDIFESIENAQRIAIASINALENSVKEVDEDMKRLRAFCDL